MTCSPYLYVYDGNYIACCARHQWEARTGHQHHRRADARQPTPRRDRWGERMTAIKCCEVCGAEYRRPNRYANAMWEQRRYCSVLCRNTQLGIDRVTPETTYGQAHKRVRRTFGPVKEQDCADCGAPATEYAFNHSDGPSVRTAPNGRRYSLNVDDYEPVCRSCHRRRDRSTVCRNGLHEMTDENRWRDTNACVACRKANSRKGYEKRLSAKSVSA